LSSALLIARQTIRQRAIEAVCAPRRKGLRNYLLRRIILRFSDGPRNLARRLLVRHAGLRDGDAEELSAARAPQGLRADRRAAPRPDRQPCAAARGRLAARARADGELRRRPLLDPRGAAHARVAGGD